MVLSPFHEHCDASYIGINAREIRFCRPYPSKKGSLSYQIAGWFHFQA
jgi:hypothetical protein